MDNVVRAILASHDPSTSNQQRVQALELLERVKNNVGENFQISTQLLAHSNPIIKHFAFHSLEMLVKAKWNQLDSTQKEKLKEFTVKNMFPLSQKVKAHFLREKIADVVTQIALREWPQRWPKLLPMLFQIAGIKPERGQQNGGAMGGWLGLTLLMIIRNLAAQIIAFDPNVPEKRCREIQEGLKASMGPISFLIASILKYHLQSTSTSETNVRKRAIGLSIESIGAVVDWVDPVFIYGTTPNEGKTINNDGVLELVFSAFNMGDFCVSASGILTTICMKNTMTKYNPILYKLWAPMLNTNETLLKTKITDVERRSLLLQAVISPLNKLMRNHVDLIVEGGGDSNKKMRFKFLNLTLQLLNHDLISIARRGIEMCMHLLRYKWNKVVDSEWRENLAVKIFDACLKQNTRRSWKSMSSEYGTEKDHHHAFAGLRSQLHVLMENLVRLHPPLVVNHLVCGYLKLLHSMQQQQQQQFEALLENFTSGTEHVVRAIPKKSQNDQKVLSSLGNLLRGLLAAKNLKSSTRCFQYVTLGLLHPLYQVNQDAITAALKTLLEGVQYRTPNQAKIPADHLDKDTMICRRRALDSLIKITKRHRSNLARSFKVLSQMVQSIMKKGHGWVRDEEKMSLIECLMPISNEIPNAEQVNFIKFIIVDPLKRFDHHATTLFKDVKSFVQATGLPSLKTLHDASCRKIRQEIWWALDLLRGLIRHTLIASKQTRSVERGYADTALGRDKNEEKSSSSSSLPHIPEHLRGVIRHLLSKERIRALMLLTGCTNRALDPSISSKLPPQVQASLKETREMMEEALRKLLAKDQIQQHQYQKQQLIVREMHTWFRTVRACAYVLLGYAAKYVPQDLFPVAMDGGLLGQTAFGSLKTMPSIYLKVVTDQLLPNLLKYFPLTNKGQIVAFQRLLGSIFHGIFSRLGQGWAQCAARLNQQQQQQQQTQGGRAGCDDRKEAAAASSSAVDEIREVSTLTDVQRSFVHCISTLLCVPMGISGIRSVRNTFYPPTATSGAKNLLDEGKTGETKRIKEQQTNPHVPSKEQIQRSNMVLELIITDRNLLNLTMAIFMALMIWPDSPSSVNACTFVLRFVPPMIKSAVARQNTGHLMIKVFQTSLEVLERLRKELEEATHGAHMGLLKEMYEILVPLGLDGLRKLLQQIPGIPPQEIINLEKTIINEPGDKNKRRAFKRFLTRYVVGLKSNAGRVFAVRDLPEGFISTCNEIKARRKKGTNDTDTNDNLGDAFEWLFDR
eukprot:jgi/Bigna1/72002/fgenesh1_pg.18_\